MIDVEWEVEVQDQVRPRHGGQSTELDQGDMSNRLTGLADVQCCLLS